MRRLKSIQENSQLFLTKMLLAMSLLGLSTLALAQGHMRSINYEGVNVRAGAGTNHEVLWRVVLYFPYQVLETKGVWLKVRDFEGDIGWVHSRYLSKTASVVIKNKFANVRAEPSLSGKKLGKVNYGDVFVVLARQKDWVQIKLPNGTKAWVFDQLVWGL